MFSFFQNERLKQLYDRSLTLFVGWTIREKKRNRIHNHLLLLIAPRLEVIESGLFAFSFRDIPTSYVLYLAIKQID